MSKLIEIIKTQIPNDFFTTAELMRILLKSPDGRYGLVKRAIAKGDIIRIRRGLYVLSKRHQRNGIDLFELAQTIYGPSYISLESALSYHGWIPEGVQTTTSISQNRSREFKTPLGVFSYSRMSKFNYIGVERISSGRSLFLMADPVKALVDMVFVLKKDWKGAAPLLSSLRIESEDLKKINKETLNQLKNKILSQRVTRFIDGLMKDMDL
jgi:predicted transcriptional regulator of viral defense system